MLIQPTQLVASSVNFNTYKEQLITEYEYCSRIFFPEVKNNIVYTLISSATFLCSHYNLKCAYFTM